MKLLRRLILASALVAIPLTATAAVTAGCPCCEQCDDCSKCPCCAKKSQS